MTAADPQPTDFNPDNSRLIALSDGVFAFALTLLVINLKVPDADTVARRGLAHAVLAESRTFTIWVLSFFVISLYWQGHHRLFDALHGHDRRLVWLNLLFLLCVSFIWYPTSVLGSYGQYQFAVLFYNGSLILTSLTAMALWQYAVHDARLLDHRSAPAATHEEWWRAFGTIG